jgi:ribosomal protein L12E/L44/L45/RPP1/RPP2
MQDRYNRLPFSPSYEFRATRAFVMQGIEYTIGMPIDKAGIETRRLRQMYDSRMIEAILDAAPAAPAPAKAPAKKAEAKAQKAEAPKVEATPTEANKSALSVDYRGFGRYFVIDAEGKEISGPHSKDEAHKLAK